VATASAWKENVSAALVGLATLANSGHVLAIATSMASVTMEHVYAKMDIVEVIAQSQATINLANAPFIAFVVVFNSARKLMTLRAPKPLTSVITSVHRNVFLNALLERCPLISVVLQVYQPCR